MTSQLRALHNQREAEKAEKKRKDDAQWIHILSLCELHGEDGIERLKRHVTLLEELNPRRLHLEEIKKEPHNQEERRLSYSRHYSAKGSRSHRYERHGSPVIVRRPRSAREYYAHPSHRRDLLGGEPSHVDVATEIVHEKPEPVSKQLKDHLVPFHDENRTPTPAVNIAEHMLEEARHRREHHH